MDFVALNGRNQQTGATFQIAVPSHRLPRGVHQQLRAQQLRDDPQAAMVTTHQAGRMRMDEQMPRRMYIVDRDERVAKYDKPWAVLDHNPGQMPRLIVGGGAMHRGALGEWADQEAHYSKGIAAELFPNGGRRDLQMESQIAVEKLRDALAGRKRYAFGKRDGLATGALDNWC